VYFEGRWEFRASKAELRAVSRKLEREGKADPACAPLLMSALYGESVCDHSSRSHGWWKRGRPLGFDRPKNAVATGKTPLPEMMRMAAQ
jgi:hypothetical protein